jgi:hypothetical protein
MHRSIFVVSGYMYDPKYVQLRNTSLAVNWSRKIGTNDLSEDSLFPSVRVYNETSRFVFDARFQKGIRPNSEDSAAAPC